VKSTRQTSDHFLTTGDVRGDVAKLCISCDDVGRATAGLVGNATGDGPAPLLSIGGALILPPGCGGGDTGIAIGASCAAIFVAGVAVRRWDRTKQKRLTRERQAKARGGRVE
jgi:hypothetical protein